MVFHHLCNGILMAIGWYEPSIVTSAYIGFGFCLYIQHVLCKSFSTSFYKVSLLSSFLSSALKLFILSTDSYEISEIIFTRQVALNSVLPDLIVLLISMIGLINWYPIQSIRFYFCIKVLAHLLSGFISLTHQSFASLIYLALLVYTIINYCILKNSHDRVIGKCMSLVSAFHLAYPYGSYLYYYLGFEDGIFVGSDWGILTALIFILHVANCLIACRPEVQNAEILIRLIENQSSEEEKDMKTIDKILYAGLYIATVVLLWMLVILFTGPIGLFLMLWIFYSILEKENAKIKKTIKILLLPGLTLLLITFYAIVLFEAESIELGYLFSFESMQIQIALIFAAIGAVALFYKFSHQVPAKHTLSNSFHEEIFASIFGKMYIISLVVLFLVGLSDINLMHTVLMILCLLFMISAETQKSYWSVLIYYTMGMLGIRYFWILIQPLVVDFSDNALLILEIMGLSRSNTSSTAVFIPYDYLIWLLLLTACIQKTAYNFKLKRSQKKSNVIIQVLYYIYSYVIHIEIWVMYFAMIMIQFVSIVNFLNMLRVLILFGIIAKHLYNIRNKIENNYMSLHHYLVLLKVYNGLLLAARYIFQFLSFYSNSKTLEFPNLGFQVYDKETLYTSTASDFCLLLASVLASRNCDNILRRHSPIAAKAVDKKNSFFYNYFSNPFKYIVVLSVFTIAIFAKLSFSMFINIMIIGCYEIHIANYFTNVSNEEASWRDGKWNARVYMWKALFINTSLAMVLSYARFLLNDKFFSNKMLGQLEWAFFISGFTKDFDSDLPISHCYPFAILFTLLIIECHCLQFIMPPTIASDQAVNAEESPVKNMNSKEEVRNTNFISVLNLFKAIAEALVPMLILLLAFDKGTIISVFYVVLVLIGSCSKELTNTRFFYTVLILVSLIQYAFILSNINKETSSHIPKSDPPVKIPWFESDSSQASAFLNLGTKMTQLHSVYYDMLTQIFLLCYYFNLSFREKQLQNIIRHINRRKSSASKDNEVYSNKRKRSEEFKLVHAEEMKENSENVEEEFNQKIWQNDGGLYTINEFNEDKNSSFLNPIKEKNEENDEYNLGTYENSPEKITEISKHEKRIAEEKSKKERVEKLMNNIKELLIFIKEKFYQFSRYLVVCIALLFITQSLGLLSAFYCCFCLVFIIKENEIYDSQNTNSYTDLLIAFLRFLILDLTLQIFIQLPLTYINDDSFEMWCHYIGLMNLKDDTDLEALENKYMTILFKIYTFFIVFMVYKMMKSKDYKNYINTVFKNLEKNSKSIGESMARSFNKQRIDNNQSFADSKQKFDRELKTLEISIEKWNEEYTNSGLKELKRHSTILNNSGKRSSRTNFKSQPTLMLFDENKSRQKTLTSFLIDLINPKLFRAFLRSMTPVIIREKNLKKHHQYIEENSAPVLLSTFSVDLDTKFRSINEKLSENNSESANNSSDSISDSSEALNKSQEYVRSDSNVSCELEKSENYSPKFKHYIFIILYAIASNTEALVYLSFFLNHWKYASFESVVFPLSALGFAMIDFPRPTAAYFKCMLWYAEIVFFVKFCLQLDVLNFDMLNNYKDDWKIGFNRVQNTYSQSLFYYVFWDVIVMIALLLNNFYLIKVGLWNKTEIQIESLHEAKIRLKFIPGPKIGISNKRNIPNFFNRLLPKNKQEKPGRDFYLYTVLIQMLILVYIFCFFSLMSGNSENISQALRSNQFQGKMVAGLIVQIMIIIIERYFYVNRVSQAIKDAEKAPSDVKPKFPQKSMKIPKMRIRSTTIYDTLPEGIELTPLHPMGKTMTIQNNLLDEGENKEEIKKQENESEVERRLPIYFRVGIHLILILLVHFLVFWYLPISGNSYPTLYCSDLTNVELCNNFQINYFIQGFYLLYMAYFVFASLQIKHGLPSLPKATFPLVRNASQANYYIFKLYRTLPFLFEIRTLIDWTFSETALNLFQWFKFEDIYAQLFINQCYQKMLKGKKYGDTIKWVEKCYMGVCGLLIILMVILLPLMLFSSLNPVTIPNPVNSASLDVRFIHENRMFKLYTISSAEEMSEINEENWEERGFIDVPEITESDRKQMQTIRMPASSDTIWDISKPNKEKLCWLINQDLQDKNEKKKSQIEVSYTFFRDYPESDTEVKLKKRSALDQATLNIFNDTICSKSSTTVLIPKMFNQIIRLPSNGEKITPMVIENEDFTKDLILDLIEESGEWGRYWSAMTYNIYGQIQGVRFYTISDNYSEITMNISIITFYISIVYVVGTLIKLSTRGSGLNVIMTDMSITESLQTICEGIYISRMIGNFDKEEELYYELIDILRSPEIMKMITGTSSIKKSLELVKHARSNSVRDKKDL